MLAIGPDDFREMLAGFRAMDEHFRTAPLEREPAGAPGSARRLVRRTSSAFETHAVLPYEPGAERLPRLPAAARHGVNGKPSASTATRVDYHTGPIVWGTAGTNGQHAYYQLLHQGTQLVPADFIGFVNPHHGHRRPPRPAHREPVRAGRGARVRQDARGGDRRGRAGAPGRRTACSRATGRRPDPRRPADAAVARRPDRALRAQGVRPGRDLGHRLVRPVGRGAGQGRSPPGSPPSWRPDGGCPAPRRSTTALIRRYRARRRRPRLTGAAPAGFLAAGRFERALCYHSPSRLGHLTPARVVNSTRHTRNGDQPPWLERPGNGRALATRPG